MAGNQQLTSNGQVVESVTPEQVLKDDRKVSRNPLKSWFKGSGASSHGNFAGMNKSSSTNSEGSASKAKQKPPLLVHYFPTANRPSLR